MIQGITLTTGFIHYSIIFIASHCTGASIVDMYNFEASIPFMVLTTMKELSTITVGVEIGGHKIFRRIWRGLQNVWRFTIGSKNLLSYSTSNMCVNTIARLCNGVIKYFYTFEGGLWTFSMRLKGGDMKIVTIMQHFIPPPPSCNCW